MISYEEATKSIKQCYTSLRAYMFTSGLQL
jgi:hypothetical protein